MHFRHVQPTVYLFGLLILRGREVGGGGENNALLLGVYILFDTKSTYGKLCLRVNFDLSGPFMITSIKKIE